MRKSTVVSLRRRCLSLWGKIILSRDPVCIVCGREPSKHPHHIFPKSRYRHLLFDLRNGAALCIGDHYRAHYDPVRPVLRFQAHLGDRFNALVFDAFNGRRRNPYGKKELANIAVALQAELKAGTE